MASKLTDIAIRNAKPRTKKFTSVHAALHNHFNHERHLIDRNTCKTRRSAAMAEWRILAA
jgi:putative transposase